MKLLIILSCLAFAVNAATVTDLDFKEWRNYKLKYNKTYPSGEEEKFRMKIFLENKQEIDEHNEKFKKGEVTFEMGVNKFSDLLQKEFVEMYTGFKKIDNGFSEKNIPVFIPPTNVELPTTVNWTEKGAVTPVKNQEQCGSCWAFSSTGALEGQHFKKTGKLVSLSEQNLVDCSRSQGNFGCEGGYPELAFTYVKKNNGIDTEESYPYEAVDGDCRFNASTVGATDVGFLKIPQGSETALKVAVATVGPISVAIRADLASFRHYKSGIYRDPNCYEFINHAVLTVGYGTDNQTQEDYWLVKNSWGEFWGELGYIKIARNACNMCEIASLATYPLV